jgi:hypothetical protein
LRECNPHIAISNPEGLLTIKRLNDYFCSLASLFISSLKMFSNFILS